MARRPMPFPSHNVIVFLISLFSFQLALCRNNLTDVQALLAFKAAITFDPLQVLSSWNETIHFCSWRGVACSHRHNNRVVSIDLMSQGLIGSLSPYIGNLSFLKNINLRNNSFNGQIPREIGRLRRLEHVELSINSFGGEIPRNLSQCTKISSLNLNTNNLRGRIIIELSSLVKLQVLNLSFNRLSETIPPWIGNMTSLVRLSLTNCSLGGHIPEEIGRLRYLEYVELSNNSLSGEIPRNLSQCQNLYKINFINNKLTGRIVSEISSLVRLQALGLSRNMLSGTIPPSIGNLTSLIWLSLGHCGLEGQIPESLSLLRNLQFLFLLENKLTGKIPSELFNSSISYFALRSNKLQGTIPPNAGYTLQNIRILELHDNNLRGEIPASLQNASSIEEIVLSSNNFRGPMLRDLGRLTSLTYFVIAENNIEGDLSFVSSLTNCTRLETLSVGANLLNGSLPDSISNLSRKLTFLSLERSSIHGRFPSGIEHLVNLAFLVLGDNYLSGPIPSSIGSLANLQELFLQGNKFNGDIPPSLGNLTLLNDLYLSYNNLSGSVPPSLGNLRNLLIFDLSHNNLKGEIPFEIFGLSSITISFNLAYNEFTGAIPREVHLLRNLGDLDLSNNKLSGSIPNAMSSCTTLERLHLEGNLFEGEIPAQLNALRALQDLDLSRNHLSGPIPSFLGKLQLLMNLNLSFNELEGEVPTLGVFRNKSAVSLDGNFDLCGGIVDLGLQSCSAMNPKNSKLSKVLKIAVSIGILGLTFSILVFLCVFMHKRKKQRKNKTSMPLFDEHFVRLSYADLLTATCGFSNANLIGAGRFGSVYKGILNDGEIMVAVKVLNLNVIGASKTFMAECNALSRIRHRNLVKILSACLSIDFQGHDFKALVYGYKSNGSLEEWLHNNPDKQDNGKRNLTMIERLNITIDIASALEYLHFGTDSIIIHGDLKPSNILLDDDMTACIGDFGLSKIILSISEDFPANENSSSTIKGTIGYIAPEYGMRGTVSTERDVYSFGILVLEIFTNIRPTDEAFSAHSNLHCFVSSALPDSMMDILDPFIVQEIQVSHDHRAEECLLSVLKIGVACSEEFPRDRMAMTDVVTELKKIRSAYLAQRRS